MLRSYRHTLEHACCRAGFMALLLIATISFPFISARSDSVHYVQHIVVALNKSVTLDVPEPFASAVVGAPEIADALPVSDRTLLIQAKKPGTTNVAIFDEGKHLIKVVDVENQFSFGAAEAPEICHVAISATLHSNARHARACQIGGHDSCGAPEKSEWRFAHSCVSDRQQVRQFVAVQVRKHLDGVRTLCRRCPFPL